MAGFEGAVIAWLRTFLRSRYTVFLEEECIRQRRENEQLRAENRGLTNSLLGTVGQGPMVEAKASTPRLAPRKSLHQLQADTERKSVQRIEARAAAAANPPDAA